MRALYLAKERKKEKLESWRESAEKSPREEQRQYHTRTKAYTNTEKRKADHNMKKTERNKESLSRTEEARQDDNGEGIYFIINDPTKAAHDDNIFDVPGAENNDLKEKEI